MKKNCWLLVLLLGLYSACEKVDLTVKPFFFVQTLEATDINLKGAKLNGAIIQQEQGIELEYGYYYAPTEAVLLSNSKKIIIYNSTISKDSFAMPPHELNNLTLGDYYFRAYAKLEGRQQLGAIKKFSTTIDLSAKIDTVINNTARLEGSISGLEELKGTVDIRGFVIALHDAPTYGTDDRIEVVGNSRDDDAYLIEFKDLAFNTTYYARPFVLVDGNVTHGSPISFRIKDGWVLKTNSITGKPQGLSKAVSISTNNAGYFGIGCTYQLICNERTNSTILWQYGSEQIQNGLPIKDCSLEEMYRENAVAFELNGTIYLGLGRTKLDNATDIIHDDFLIYRPGTTCFEPFETPFSGKGRWAAVAFTLNGKAYVGTGVDESSDELADFYEFDPIHNTWDSIGFANEITRTGANIKGRKNAIAFSVGGQAFYGLGSRRGDIADMWSLNLETKEWELVTNEFKGTARSGANTFVLNNGLCYIGGGFSGNATNAQDFFNDFWAFDPTTGDQSEVAPFPGTGRRYAIAFSFNGKGYYGGGENHERAFNDLWEYTPLEE